MDAIKYFSEKDNASGHLMSQDPFSPSYGAHTLMRLVNRSLKKTALSNNLLVDLGAGTGNSAITVGLNYSFKRVVVVDASPIMLKLSSAFLKQTGLAFTTHHNVDLSQDRINVKTGSSDFATAFNLLYFLKNLDHFMSEVGRIVKPGGYFGFNILNPKDEKSKSSLVNNNTYQPDFYFHSDSTIEKLLIKNGFSHLSNVQRSWRIRDTIEGKETVFLFIKN